MGAEAGRSPAAYGFLTDVATDLQQNGQSVYIEIDRPTAARFGITPATVDNALYDAFGQRIISTIFTQSNQYRVILESELPDAHYRDILNGIYLPSSTTTNGQVPLSSIAKFGPSNTPLSMNHQSQFVASTISFNLPPGKVAVRRHRRDLRNDGRNRRAADHPRQFSGDGAGVSAIHRVSADPNRRGARSRRAAVYIVLGILYESYIHPITILSTMPSAGIGALLALLLFKTEFSIIAFIAIILLISIVKKNAILMVDFAIDAARNGGKSSRDAIEEACLLHFRPIMMTTAAALLGALPFAFGSGEGSEMRAPLGIAIGGGLIVSQMLTLYTTPVVYLYMDRIRVWSDARRARRTGGARLANAAE